MLKINQPSGTEQPERELGGVAQGIMEKDQSSKEGDRPTRIPRDFASITSLVSLTNADSPEPTVPDVTCNGGDDDDDHVFAGLAVTMPAAVLERRRAVRLCPPTSSTASQSPPQAFRRLFRTAALPQYSACWLLSQLMSLHIDGTQASRAQSSRGITIVARSFVV